MTATSSPITSSSAASTASASATPSTSAAPVVPRPRDALSEDRLLADVAKLTSPEWKGRGSATADEAAAAKWLGASLDELAADRLGARIQPFTFGKHASQNVVGVVGKEPGAKPSADTEYVVLGAHYDHLGVEGGATFFGAEDNASGTALVLGVARALGARRAELERPVLIAFFGAEERGMKGSFHYVKTFAKADGTFHSMVNVDMIGRPLVDDAKLWFGARLLGILRDVEPSEAVGVMLSKNAPAWLGGLVKDSAKTQAIAAVFPDDLPESLQDMVRQMAEGRSDHAPFEAKGVPTVFFSSGESPDYHTPTDTIDRLDGALLEKRARVVLELVLALSRKPD